MEILISSGFRILEFHSKVEFLNVKFLGEWSCKTLRKSLHFFVLQQALYLADKKYSSHLPVCTSVAPPLTLLFSSISSFFEHSQDQEEQEQKPVSKSNHVGSSVMFHLLTEQPHQHPHSTESILLWVKNSTNNEQDDDILKRIDHAFLHCLASHKSAPLSLSNMYQYASVSLSPEQ